MIKGTEVNQDYFKDLGLTIDDEELLDNLLFNDKKENSDEVDLEEK